MTFVKEDEQGAITTSLFFHSLYKIGIDTDKYTLELGSYLAPSDLLDYTNALSKDLMTIVVRDDYYKYVKQILFILRGWAESDVGVMIR